MGNVGNSKFFVSRTRAKRLGLKTGPNPPLLINVHKHKYKKFKSKVIVIFKNRINEINDDTFNIKTIIYEYMIVFNVYIFIFNYHINDIKKVLLRKL